jgi:hypothetical protein
MKTKMNFSDITNVIERDEMRGIVGGYRSAERPQDMPNWSDGGGGYSMPSFAPGRGGKYGLGVGNTYSSMTTKFGCETNSNSKTNTTNTWNITASGASTSNPSEISRLFEYLTGKSNGQDISNFNPGMSQISAFIAGEIKFTANGQASNNILLFGTVLNEVVVNNNYHGPSKIPKGIIIDNFLNNNGTFNGYNLIGGLGSAGSSNTLDDQQRKQQMDCVFQCLGWISLMSGDTTHDSKYYEKMYAFSNPNLTTNALYNSLTGSGGGVPLNQIFDFASKFFKVDDYKNTSAKDLAKYIDPKNDPFGDHKLIGIFRNAQGGLHAVNITSVSGSILNYFDPQNSIHGTIEKVKMEGVFGISNSN